MSTGETKFHSIEPNKTFWLIIGVTFFYLGTENLNPKHECYSSPYKYLIPEFSATNHKKKQEKKKTNIGKKNIN